MTTLDWPIISPGLRWSGLPDLAGHFEEQGHRRPTTSWPAAISAGGSSAPRSSPPTSAPSTSSASPAPGAKDGVALAHYELHAWCLLVLAWVFVPFYMRSLVFTMPEFLERRFSWRRATCSRSSRSSRSSSRRSPSASSPAASCSGRCCPTCTSTSAASTIDSFWIGSILVIVLTGCTPRSAACGRSPTTTPCRCSCSLPGRSC